MKDLLIDIISEILKVPIERDKTFEWSKITQYNKIDVRVYHDLFSKVYSTLGVDSSMIGKIHKPYFSCDAYVGGSFNFVFEFDTLIDFCTHRENTLNLYEGNLKTHYDIDKWISYCRIYKVQADQYQKNQKINGFNPPNGKSAKRTLIDFIKDAYPKIENLNPTVRFCEFEVMKVNVNDKRDKSNYKVVEELLREKLS
ncbi:hypothetical protein [Pseudochryseolinea flava]|uniref:Uncharacterized protein n=1 Tax=Pseudochryseolinea flava TaxID=2059302 RepID=A0A364Y4W9_9BACT|nr:hypothetical protein [Pseudochryseolinea flava]RAW01238.1 hypothetical protein DQQ10_10015 [Pseudochryseolinea flava]